MHQIDDVASQAYTAWDLFEFERAAELFELAATLEKEAATERGPFAQPDQSFLFRLRGALCHWDSGSFERARKTLLDALVFDWKAARLWGDRRDTEKAFTRLLMERASASDHVGFVSLWQLATGRGEELNLPFPFVVPHQKQLLRACVSLGFHQGCRQIIERIDPKRLKVDHELQMLKAEADRFTGPG